jgi:hypothetical protein
MFGGLSNLLGFKGRRLDPNAGALTIAGGRSMGFGINGKPIDEILTPLTDVDPVNEEMTVADGYALFAGVTDDILIADGDHLDATDLGAGAMWNIWVQPDALGSIFPAMWKDGEYKLEMNASNKFAFYVYDAEGDYVGMVMDTAITNPALWYNIQAFWDGSAITMQTYSQTTGIVTAATADDSGVFGTWTANANDLYIGKENANFAAGKMRGAVILSEDVNLLGRPTTLKSVVRAYSGINNSLPSFNNFYTYYNLAAPTSVSLWASLQLDAVDDSGLNTLVLE